MRDTIKEWQEKFKEWQEKNIQIRRLIHQNWLMTNQVSKKDRIQFKHFNPPEIKNRLKLFNPELRNGSIFFNNIYQN